MSQTSPILVDVRRGDLIESSHRGAFIVCDIAGRIIEMQGDVQRPIYARSAIKPLQALPLIETGAADALKVSSEELAIACASHSGETRHIALVSAWLTRLGLTESALECCAHPPTHAPAARALYAAGGAPSALHNNCSGKHAGMLATCRHLGEDPRGYIDVDHPQQQRVVAVLSDMCGVDLRRAPRGIDGCGLPQFGLPLAALARGFAKFGAPDKLAADRAHACRRLGAAMVAHPFYIAGTDRFCTRATEIGVGKIVLKTGAEGVYAAAIPARGIGMAVKIDDGAARAAEIVLTALLLRHAELDAVQTERFRALLNPPLHNVAGREVGHVTPAATLITPT